METERKIAIFGLGFVGLPLALSFALRGCRVTGVDVDGQLVEDLNRGITHHLESYRGTPIQEILKEQLKTGRFQATTNPAPALAACRDIIVTVGVPVANGIPDFNPVRDAVATIAQGLRPGQLVLVRSTLTPGTTRRVLQPILESSGLKAEQDFYLAYAAERIAEGRAFEEFENMPTVVCGVGPRSLQRAREVLGIVTRAELVEASSIEVGETAKVLENISRDVDIALVNEFARFTKALGIDIFEVIRVANTHTRVNLLLPGPGVGGYCVPNALYYLLPRALEFNLNLRIFPTARQINDEAPTYVAGLVLKNLPVPPARAKVAVLGIAMKDYSNDDRLSPAHTVIKVLQTAGVEVRAFDPAVPTRYPFSAASLEEALQGAHGIVVLARQRGLDYQNLSSFRELMSKERPFIVDTRNIYDRAAAEKAGFHLETL
ncbi:MAG: nucleotide sugar dehydrogenase [Firmicutes bacterium]|nr:nucleotide sugar dehydrogenase [Bacillota bacterium]